ncbi:MAG: hypothetical protein KGN16_17610 [Burkholderiales bacterium]|nr:hypothetical protein [Burkholderiales bacterium]
MKQMLRNTGIAIAVAAAVAGIFAMLGALTQTPDIAGTGAMLAIACGVISWFALQLLTSNRRVDQAEPAARERALAFHCPPGRALVYFVRTGFAGKAVGFDLAVDGRTVAQIRSPRFTCIELSPGNHELSARVGGGKSAFAPAAARLTTLLAPGSVTLLHIAIRRQLTSSELAFEPWSIETARERLPKVVMVAPDAAAV